MEDPVALRVIGPITDKSVGPVGGANGFGVARGHLGTWQLDFARGVFTGNSHMFAVYGLDATRSQATTAQYLAAVHPDDRLLTESAFQQARRDGTALDFQHRVVTPGGCLRQVHVLGQSRLDGTGRPIGSIGTAQDITAQAARERSLREREGGLRAIFSALSEGLVILDRDGRVIDTNPAAQVILGLTREQILGRTSMDPRWKAIREDGSLYPGDAHPSMVTLRTGAALTGQVMGVEDPKRGLRWLSVNTRPVWGEFAKGPSAVVATFVDITERRQVDARLQDVCAEFQDLYDHAPCAYHSLDANGFFLRINETGLQWLECSRAELIGKLRLADFFTSEGRDRFRRIFSGLLDQGRIDNCEFDLVSRKGAVRRVVLNATAARDADGRFRSSRGVLHDFTELQQLRR